MLQFVAKNFVTEAINNLTPNYLTKLNKQFNEILKDKQMHILSLCERKSVLPWWNTNVVPPKSCTSFSAWEKLIPLQFDHSSICKPKSVKDIRYAVARQYLLELPLNISSFTEPTEDVVIDPVNDLKHAQPQKYEMIVNSDKYCSRSNEWLKWILYCVLCMVGFIVWCMKTKRKRDRILQSEMEIQLIKAQIMLQRDVRGGETQNTIDDEKNKDFNFKVVHLKSVFNN